MYQDERKLDFKPIGMAIKKAREAKGWTQEYLVQLVDLCKFTQVVVLPTPPFWLAWAIVFAFKFFPPFDFWVQKIALYLM